MPELAAPLRAAALLAVWLVSGRAVARLTRGRGDVFETTWWALALASVCGLVLARAGWFSFAALVTSGGVIAVLAGGASGVVATPVVASGATRASRGLQSWACAAGVLAIVAAWPPFETFLGAADSTMYVNAGVHLARTGSYEVRETTTQMLPPELASALFPSVGLRGLGPFIRLPGGLLTRDLATPSATPAFFPLVPVWTGALTSIGGPELATLVAPVGLGLAVWALTLFAGETIGLTAAVATALVFTANFAVWWFGRFPMSEPLTIAFLWGGLVLVGRRAPFAAGVMFGLAGLARAESLLFVVVAIALLAAWGAVPSRDLARLALGCVVPGLVLVTGLVASPNHHFAYIQDAMAFTWLRMILRLLPAYWDGRLVAALALLPLIPLGAGIVASRRGAYSVSSLVRTAISMVVALGIVGYLVSGSRAAPLRHLGWVATSLSPLGLALALVGLGLLWRRGGLPARLTVVLVVLVGAVFIPKPQISSYQPWAMRRFLPIVLPGLALGVGAVVARAMRSPRRVVHATTIAVLVAVVVMQSRPIWAIRRAPYFSDNLQSVQRVADVIPPDALVVVDSGFGDAQLQVALWLIFDRETVVVTGGRPAWEKLLTVLLAGGRTVYWIQNRLAPRPSGTNLVFTSVAGGGDKDLTVVVPDGPADTPPALTIRKLVPLGVYGVTLGSGSGGGEGKSATTFGSSPSRSAHSPAFVTIKPS